MISHELRTPLTALAGYSELLTEGVFGPLSAQQSEVVERMRAVTNQLALMIDKLLTFSNLECGGEKAVLASFRPAEVISDVLMAMDPLAKKEGVRVDADIRHNPEIYSDREKVRQILLQFVDNGIKFTAATPEKGEVQLSVAREGNSVNFIVRDQGTGIQTDNIAEIFKPFFQVDAGLTRLHGGMGIGLHISERLAELIGGRIDVITRKGEGSTFILSLPATAPPPI